MVSRILALAMLLAGGAAPAVASDKTVAIDNFTFKPAAIEVKVGDRVTFKNEDDIPHSVVAADGAFHSKALDTGDAFSFTFTKAGDVTYSCGLHPFMKGMVKVVP